MTNSSDKFIPSFLHYRTVKGNDKKHLLATLLRQESTLELQKMLLVYALDYDILHPAADGQENFLRRSEISVALLRDIFKTMPAEADRQKFLQDVFRNISPATKLALTQRRMTTKTGENIQRQMPPFALFYNLFLTMVFIDVSAFSQNEMLYYSTLQMDIQTLKHKVNHALIDKEELTFQLHNALTQLEYFKLNYLRNVYGLTLPMLAHACSALYGDSFELLATESNTPVTRLGDNADYICFKVMFEVNKYACRQENTFGQLRFYEKKPLPATNDDPQPSFNLTHRKLIALHKEPALSAEHIPFWEQKVQQAGKYIAMGADEIYDSIASVPYFQQY